MISDYKFTSHPRYYNIKDPCENCLVKACCKVACNQYERYWRFKEYEDIYLNRRKHNRRVVIYIIAYVIIMSGLIIKGL